MRQQDLRYPYSFAERKPIFHNQVLFIPRHYSLHEEWKEELLAQDRPIFVEFCSGNGEWIINKALEYPDIQWVAVEKKFDRIRKIWVKKEQKGLKNLLIVAGEAETYAQFYLKEGSVDQIFVNFPDPWPKDRHAKHRLIQTPFMDTLAHCMKQSAIFTLVTDDVPYRDQVIDVLSEHPLFSPQEVNHEGYGSSYFHRLWVEKGRDIHYIRYQRT